MLRHAYKKFERQVESARALSAKTGLVRQTTFSQVEPFALAELSAQLPSVSAQPIKEVLAELKKAGKARLTGRGRGTS